MEAINISRYWFSALTTTAHDYRNINFDKIEIKPSKIDRPMKKQESFLSFFININNTDSRSWLFSSKSFSNTRNKLDSSRKFIPSLYLNRKIIHRQIVPWATIFADTCTTLFLGTHLKWMTRSIVFPLLQTRRRRQEDICLQTVVCKHNCKLFWKNIGKHFGNKRNIICIFTLASKVFWKYFQVYGSLYTQTLHNAYRAHQF